MRRALLLLAISATALTLTYGQSTSLSGKVTDGNTGEAILFGCVALYDKGNIVTGTETDFDGNYNFSKIEPGTYDVEASYVGYPANRTKGVVVIAGKSNILNIEIFEGQGVDLDEIVVIEYRAPLISYDNTTQGSIVTSENIKNLPKRNINGLAATSAGATITSSGADLSIRGSRTSGTTYVVDGISTSEPAHKKELPKAGQLTAGEWNDLTHWDDWKKLLKNESFADMQNHWQMFPQNRFPVFVTNKHDLPLANCKVALINKKDEVIWQAYTDNGGSAQLWSGAFGADDEVKEIRLSYQGQTFTIDKPTKVNTAANHFKIPYACEQNNEVEVMFVVDATGSMRDEIEYLRSEISDVIQTVKTTEQETELKTGAVFYGDYETDFVVKSSPLSKNAKECISFMTKEKAVDGGRNGDTPEAVELGLEEALAQPWSETAHTKIIFLVLDAAAHHNEEVMSILQAQIIQAASMGIKIIPVTGSSLQRDGEFLMKFLALFTNGTYVFITDDSGIGGKHLKPVHDDYSVETLNELLIRLIVNYSESKSCSDLETSGDNMQGTSLYPNPASTKSKLKLSEKADLITLHASSGKVVRTFRNPKNKIEIDCHNLTAGIYTVCIYREDNKEVERLVVVGK